MSRTQYGEADLIVSFLSHGHGKISGIAKHARKSRKRFGGVLSPGVVSELTFTHKSGRDLVRLESGDFLRSFDHIAEDVGLLGQAGLVLELSNAFAPPHDPSPDLFDLVIWCLSRLDRADRPDEAVIVFGLRLFSLAGFGPNLDSCCLCGRASDEAAVMNLKTDQGGLICGECGGGGFALSQGTRKLMVLIQGLPLDKLDRVRLGDAAQAESRPFVTAYARHVLGRDLKALGFLEQLKNR